MPRCEMFALPKPSKDACHASTQTKTKDEWDAAHTSFANKSRTLTGCDEVSSNQVKHLLPVEANVRDKRKPFSLIRQGCV